VINNRPTYSNAVIISALFYRPERAAIRRADKYLCLTDLREDYLIKELWNNIRGQFSAEPENQWYKLLPIFDWYFDKKILNDATIRSTLLPLIKETMAKHRQP
jgi:hypothetical protein